MSKSNATRSSRRRFLAGAAATAGIAATGGFVPARFAIGQQAKLKLGLMLPYTGTFASLGNNITDAFKLAINQAGGKLGGREIEYVQLDDESDPAKATANANKLIVGEKVDFVIGTVHSGVALGMVKVARDEDAMLVIPNAGAGAATGEQCAPNIFRTSFTNWQPAFPMGNVMLKDGHKKVVAMYWKYAAGLEFAGGFKDSFLAGGGAIVKEIQVDFPTDEFQAHLTEIASLKPDAVYVFFAGGGALKYVKDYAAAGLKDKIPLYGSGFLTDGVLAGQGAAAEGIKTTLHYADGLDLPANLKFRAAFKGATNREADVYAVQGYDTGQLLIKTLAAVKGDVKARKDLIKTMETAEIDSPRGKWTMSKAHNPIQDIYLRQVQNGKEVVLGVAHKALADPAKGCKMA
jgi:branched-chain amino acid transport system substrate-binding protein